VENEALYPVRPVEKTEKLLSLKFSLELFLWPKAKKEDFK